MLRRNFLFIILIVLFSVTVLPISINSQDDIDDKVQAFLYKYRWRDMNVPASDGKALYDIIVENGYTRALEIGTSTGHSGIWIAWALSKTGGKLTTIEIDESRHNAALKNFEEAGVSAYIDARLGDAHVITKELKGPFDFVFSDADKNWYTNYAKTLLPKLTVGGCYTTHNVSQPYTSRGFRGRRGGGGSSEYVEFLLSQPNLKTTFIMGGSGLSVSYKTAE
ncbi:O-methyltransferase [Candidatus Latescibacterota bacterium]